MCSGVRSRDCSMDEGEEEKHWHASMPTADQGNEPSTSAGATKAKMLQKKRSAKKRAKSFKIRRELDSDRQKLNRLIDETEPADHNRYPWLQRSQANNSETEAQVSAGGKRARKGSARSRLEQGLLAFRDRITQNDFGALNEDITAIWAAKKRIQDLDQRTAGASGDKETYASVLQDLEQERSRLSELVLETPPKAIHAQMDAAAALHRTGMELLQRVQRLGPSAKIDGFMTFLDTLTMLQMQLKVGYLLHFEIFKMDFPATERKMRDIAQISAQHRALSGAGTVVASFSDTIASRQNQISLTASDGHEIDMPDGKQNCALHKYTEISNLASDIKKKLDDLRRIDPLSDNQELVAAQKELVKAEKQASSVAPGSLHDTGLEGTRKKLARQSSFKKVQQCKAHLRQQHHEKVAQLQEQLEKCHEQMELEHAQLRGIVQEALAEKTALAQLRAYMRQLLDALRMRVALEEQNALLAVAKAEETVAGRDGKLSIQRRGSVTQKAFSNQGVKFVLELGDGLEGVEARLRQWESWDKHLSEIPHLNLLSQQQQQQTDRAGEDAVDPFAFVVEDEDILYESATKEPEAISETSADESGKDRQEIGTREIETKTTSDRRKPKPVGSVRWTSPQRKEDELRAEEEMEELKRIADGDSERALLDHGSGQEVEDEESDADKVDVKIDVSETSQPGSPAGFRAVSAFMKSVRKSKQNKQTKDRPPSSVKNHEIEETLGSIGETLGETVQAASPIRSPGRKQSVLALASAELADDTDIDSWLQKIRLRDQLQAKIDELGIVVVEELVDLDEDDAKELRCGLKKMEVRRLDDALSLLRQNSRLDELGISLAPEFDIKSSGGAGTSGGKHKDARSKRGSDYSPGGVVGSTSFLRKIEPRVFALLCFFLVASGTVAGVVVGISSSGSSDDGSGGNGESGSSSSTNVQNSVLKVVPTPPPTSPAPTPFPTADGLIIEKCEDESVRIECEAWQHLYHSTGGTGWSRCSQQRLAPCDCRGVKCEYGHIVSVSLQMFGLRGTLPPAVAKLSQLTHLSLGFNSELTGTIPADLTKLEQLRELQMYCNSFEGTVPAFDFQSLAGSCGLGGPTTKCKTNKFDCPLPSGAEQHCFGSCQ